MNQKFTLAGGAAVVALIVGFGAGYFMPHTAQGRGQYGGGTFMVNGQAVKGGNGVFVRGGAGGNAVAGQIISSDASGITVKMQDGSSKIVLVGGSTQILKSTSGTPADLSAGSNVTVEGTANSDGSITAQMIQIRPAGMMFGSTTRAQ